MTLIQTSSKDRFKFVWEILTTTKKHEKAFMSLKDETNKKILADSVILELSVIIYGADRSCGTASGAAFAIADFFKAFDIKIDGGFAWGIDIQTQNDSGPAVIFGGIFIESLFESILRNELVSIFPRELSIRSEFLNFMSTRIRRIINDAENIGRMMTI